MPVSDNRQLFEKICLEGFQAGVSWLTILNKREAFRLAFADFDIDEVAAFDDSDVKRLLLDAGIVRHCGKIASSINNAKRAQEMRAEFGTLATYFWQFGAATNAAHPRHTVPQATQRGPKQSAGCRSATDVGIQQGGTPCVDTGG